MDSNNSCPVAKPKTQKPVVLIIKTFCFLTVVFVLLCSYTFIFRDKNEANIVKPYYDEPDDSLDIVFVGSSHIMCSIYAMELYDEFGYTSYGFASSSQLLPQSYYQVIAALETQNPQLIVLDISGSVYDGRYGMESYAHVQTDNIRYSMNKINLINDLFDKEDRLPYFINLIQFHSRWKELLVYDFQPIKSVTKGAYISYSSTPQEDLLVLDSSETSELAPEAEEYLRKIIELCQDREIPLLLLNVPGKHTDQDFRRVNKAVSIAGEYGVPSLNMMYYLDELELDMNTDFRDEYHCNAFGAIKVTEFIGTYLDTHYNIDKKDVREIEEKWNEDLIVYRQFYPDGHGIYVPETEQGQ